MAATELQCKVTGYKDLTPTVFEILFEPSAPVTFKAGQFISIVIPGAGPNGRDLRRAYSIASSPEKLPVELCVKLVEGGPGTNYLVKLRPGDSFRGFAPYGDFVYEPCANRGAMFISTGTGIAPFRSMVLSEHYRKSPPKGAYMLLGVREVAELLYMDEMGDVPGLTWVPCVSRPEKPWSGFTGRVTDYMRTLKDFAWKDFDYYLCGGGAMINEVKAILTEQGVDKEQIHQEVYYKEPKPA